MKAFRKIPPLQEVVKQAALGAAAIMHMGKPSIPPRFRRGWRPGWRKAQARPAD